MDGVKHMYRTRSALDNQLHITYARNARHEHHEQDT
jgi:hypothetical protein